MMKAQFVRTFSDEASLIKWWDNHQMGNDDCVVGFELVSSHGIYPEGTSILDVYEGDIGDYQEYHAGRTAFWNCSLEHMKNEISAYGSCQVSLVFPLESTPSISAQNLLDGLEHKESRVEQYRYIVEMAFVVSQYTSFEEWHSVMTSWRDDFVADHVEYLDPKSRFANCIYGPDPSLAAILYRLYDNEIYDVLKAKYKNNAKSLWRSITEEWSPGW